MAKIIINGITHEEACTWGCDESAAQDYADRVDTYMESLEKLAIKHGFEFEVDWNAQGTASYRVTDEADFEDYQAAHDFMQSAPDFWS